MSAGCYHDNCTGANKVFNLQEVRTWRCFQQVAEVIGDEDAEWELGKVLMQINEQGFGEWDSEEDLEVNFLGEAFEWEWAVQGFNFWSTIHQGIKPEGYDTTPDTPPTPEVDKKPELIIPDDAKGSSEEPPKQSKTVGELIEDIAYKLPQSSLEITIKANGSAYLHGEGLPVVDITKLEVETVDKLLDVLVECAGCFVEFNEQGD